MVVSEHYGCLLLEYLRPWVPWQERSERMQNCQNKSKDRGLLADILAPHMRFERAAVFEEGYHT